MGVDADAVTDTVGDNAGDAAEQDLTNADVTVTTVADVSTVSTVGTECENDDTCTGAGQTCNEDTGTCTCDTSKYVTSGNVCVEKTVVGAECEDAGCTGDKQVCTDEACACNADTLTAADDNGQCTVGKVGASCGDDSGVTCPSNMECTEDEECACEDGFRAATDDSRCVQDELRTWYFTLTIDVDFVDELADRTSDEFMDRQTELDTYCTTTLNMCGIYPTCEITILLFKEGSQIVTGQADMRGGLDETRKQVEDSIAEAPNNQLDGADVQAGRVSDINFDGCELEECAVGAGDCDDDSQCAGDLKCGVNNCVNTDDPLAD